MAGLDETETGNELSQPTFEFTKKSYQDSDCLQKSSNMVIDSAVQHK